MRKFFISYKIFFYLTFQNFLSHVQKILFSRRHVRMLPVWQKTDVWGVKKWLSHDFIRRKTHFFHRKTHFFHRKTHFFRRTPDVFCVEWRFSPHFLFCHNAGFCPRNVSV